VRVERLRTKFDIDLKWTHFPLHPSTPEAGLTLEQLFAGRQMDIAASKARMKRLMEEEGLDYGDRTMTYNSRLAQEMAHWAESAKGAVSVHNALFRAYFVDRLNLSDISVLVCRDISY
jgi:predicted DsbA family dithiol-disulfide isomerase